MERSYLNQGSVCLNEFLQFCYIISFHQQLQLMSEKQSPNSTSRKQLLDVERLSIIEDKIRELSESQRQNKLEISRISEAQETLDGVTSPIQDKSYGLMVADQREKRGDSIASNRSVMQSGRMSIAQPRVSVLEKQFSNTSVGKVPNLLPASNFQNQLNDVGIDWFHFETRIRRVILEVVDPLTKKQFQSFEGIDDIGKQVLAVYQKYEETIIRMDRVVKRNEAMDQIEKRLKEVEGDLMMHKALQRNDQTQLLERIETINARLRVSQTEMNSFSRFEDRLKIVQQSILDVTDEYNKTVTNRLKEVTHGFIKQVQEVDQRYRETQRDLQEVLVKIDNVRQFTESNDSRFDTLQAFINELRETFEDSQVTLTKGEVNGENIQSKLRAQIQALEKQVESFKLVQEEQSTELKNNLHAVTNNRLEQMIFQNQVEMIDRIFNLKYQNVNASNGGSSPSVHSRRKGQTIGDFQLNIQQNIRTWRQQQVERGRHDTNIMLEPFPPADRRGSNFAFALHKQEIENNSSNVNLANVEEVNENDQILKQQMLLLNKSTDGMSVEAKKHMQDMAIIDQEAMIDGFKAHRKATEIPMMRPSISSVESPQFNLIEAFQGTMNNSDSEEDDDEISPQKSLHKARIRLNSFMQNFNEDRLKELLKLELAPYIEHMSESKSSISLLTSQINQMQTKLAHEPLLQMIGRNRQLIENIKEDVTKMKENDGRTSLTFQIQKVEVQLNIFKNDLQQQIYKMKEFDEQLYMKSIEVSDKVDYELIKLKKSEADLSASVEKTNKENRTLRSDLNETREMVLNTADAICALVEMEAVTSSLEQQDEVDIKNVNNDESQRYQPSNVNLMGMEFPRQGLIYCRRMMLDTLLLQIINTKQPFTFSRSQMKEISNLEIFRKHLVEKVKVNNDEFQYQLDTIAEEQRLKEKRENNILPKEVMRIKELHRLTNNTTTIQEQQKKEFKRNHFQEEKNSSPINNAASSYQSNPGVIRSSNMVVYQQSNQTRNRMQANSTAPMGGLLSNINQASKYNQNLNQSMMDIHNDALPSIVANRSGTRLQKNHGIMMNVGNIDLLPRDKQPSKGPMLLQKQSRNAPSITNAKVTLSVPPPEQRKEAIQPSGEQHFQALEVRQADILLPGTQSMLSSGFELLQRSLTNQSRGAMNLQIPTISNKKSYDSDHVETSNFNSYSAISQPKALRNISSTQKSQL